MKQEQQLGLDELMIVNPGLSPGEALFLGADGILYQVQGLGEAEGSPGMGQFFLGEDGTLYQIQGDSSGSDQPDRYFLGADGVLYELVR
jgi:hypothetical protein